MSLEYYDEGLTTVCRDTPENRAEFARLKSRINARLNPPKAPKKPRRRGYAVRILYGYNTCK